MRSKEDLREKFERFRFDCSSGGRQRRWDAKPGRSCDAAAGSGWPGSDGAGRCLRAEGIESVAVRFAGPVAGGVDAA